MVLTLVQASLFSNIPRLSVRFSLVYILFSMFGTAHALCFAPAPCAGDPFSLPHVWLDFFVYTYKFTFDYCIITTQMSFLYALWCHLFRWFPTLAEYLRWYPTPSDDDPSLVLRYFRFPFDYPSPPIRRLLEQWWPKCPPMLLFTFST